MRNSNASFLVRRKTTDGRTTLYCMYDVLFKFVTIPAASRLYVRERVFSTLTIARRKPGNVQIHLRALLPNENERRIVDEFETFGLDERDNSSNYSISVVF